MVQKDQFEGAQILLPSNIEGPLFTPPRLEGIYFDRVLIVTYILVLRRRSATTFS